MPNQIKLTGKGIAVTRKILGSCGVVQWPTGTVWLGVHKAQPYIRIESKHDTYSKVPEYHHLVIFNEGAEVTKRDPVAIFETALEGRGDATISFNESHLTVEREVTRHVGSPTEFKRGPALPDFQWMSVPLVEFRALARSISTDDARPMLTYVVARDRYLDATDSFRLARVPLETADIRGDGDALIRGMLFRLPVMIEATDVEIGFTPPDENGCRTTAVRATLPDLTYIIWAQEAQPGTTHAIGYPDFLPLITQVTEDGRCEVLLHFDDPVTVVSKLTAMEKGANMYPARFGMDPKRSSLCTQNRGWAVGSPQYDIEFQFEGWAKAKLGLNPFYLRETLMDVFEPVDIWGVLTEPMSKPVMLTTEAGTVRMLMPVRMS